MNSRAFTLSLIIAGFAVFMAYTYIEDKENQFITKYGNEVTVLKAKVDIKELEILDETKVYPAKIPQSFKEPGSLKNQKDVFNTLASVPIRKGEQITETKLTYPGIRTGLSRQISIGKRAVSIGVDVVQSANRLIRPGDRVDILVMIDYAGGKKEMQKVQTILQDVLVLSTGYNMTNSIPLVDLAGTKGKKTRLNLNTYTNYNTVTLELSPFEAQKMVFTTGSGMRPFLTLRNNDDKKRIQLQTTRLYDLLGPEGAAEAKRYFLEQQSKR